MKSKQPKLCQPQDDQDDQEGTFWEFRVSSEDWRQRSADK